MSRPPAPSRVCSTASISCGLRNDAAMWRPITLPSRSDSAARLARTILRSASSRRSGSGKASSARSSSALSLASCARSSAPSRARRSTDAASSRVRRPADAGFGCASPSLPVESSTWRASAPTSASIRPATAAASKLKPAQASTAAMAGVRPSRASTRKAIPSGNDAARLSRPHRRSGTTRAAIDRLSFGAWFRAPESTKGFSP